MAFFRFSFSSFVEDIRETNVRRWSDKSLLMIPVFADVSKIKFFNMLSIKVTVSDITLVCLVIIGMKPCEKMLKTFSFDKGKAE